MNKQALNKQAFKSPKRRLSYQNKMGSSQFLLWIIISSIFLPSAEVYAAETRKSDENKLELPLSKPLPQKVLLMATAELEEKIVDSFSESKCTHIQELVSLEQYRQLRPIILAVIAFCTPSQQAAEALFKEAESAEPGKDLIWVLHARYRWKINPESSEPLWRKVLLTTRSFATKLMAKDYLEGNIEAGTEKEISLSRLWNYLIFAQIGTIHETNPLAQSNSEATNSASNAATAQLMVNAERSLDFGSIATNYTLLDSKYFSAPGVDLTVHALDFPVDFHVDSNTNLIIRPFGSYITLGHNPLQSVIGLGVTGWVYRSTYNQSIQGSFFSDTLYPSELQAQQGTHYKLEYNWEWYPSSWFLRFLFYFEHVSAAADQDITGTTFITYSHNDINLQFFVEYNFKWFILGFNPKLLIRQDDNDSIYQPQDPSLGSLVTKRRQDYQIVLQPTIKVPLAGQLQLFAWYEFNRIFSNIGAGDYQDRNILDHTVGIALKTFIGSNF